MPAGTKKRGRQNQQSQAPLPKHTKSDGAGGLGKYRQQVWVCRYFLIAALLDFWAKITASY
jgi:hypothetical protein